MPKIDFKRLRRRTLDRAPYLLSRWYPLGFWQGNELLIGNVAGEKGRSLKINSRTGLWVDHSNPNHKGGDLISLRAMRDAVSYAEAARRIQVELDGDDNPPPPSAPVAQKPTSKATVPVPDDAPPADLPEGKPHPRPEKRSYRLKAKWAYRDAEGRLINYVVRFERKELLTAKGKPAKDILPFSFVDGRWRYKGLGTPLNPLYGLDQLNQRPTAPVLLVEGEKAADAAAKLFPDSVVMTWLGGVGQLKKADFSPLRGRRVSYWRDADEAGEKSVEIVLVKLAEAGVAELLIVKLPPDLPNGWDLADEFPPGFDAQSLLQGAEPVESLGTALLRDLDFEELIQRLVFITDTEQFVDLHSGYRAKTSQLNSLYRHKSEKGICRQLLQDPRLQRVQHLAYKPGNSERIVRINDGLQVLNLWRPPDIIRVAGDVGPFVTHMRYLCTTEAEFEHLADMLAFMAQCPGYKLKSGLVLVGPPGTGKSFLSHVMRRILGAHNTANVESTDLKSDYNGYLEAKLLVIVEEVMALGRLEIMNRLKPLITQPTIRVNEKYVAGYEIENRANFIFLSNHEDALKLEDGDRRYFIVISDAEPQQQEYYDRLWAWEADNIGVILDWLLSRDLSGFKPDARPPSTEGRRRMIDAGRSDAEVLVAELIREHQRPFQHDLVELAEVRQAIADGVSGGRGITVTRPVLMRAMRSTGAAHLGQKKGTLDGTKYTASLWAVRNVERYQLMAPQALVEQFIKSRNQPGGKPDLPDAEILL